MRGAIRIGEKYLKSVQVESGFVGNSTVNTNNVLSLEYTEEPIYFTSLEIGNKIKSVVDLMRFSDIEKENIIIIIQE